MELYLSSVAGHLRETTSSCPNGLSHIKKQIQRKKKMEKHRSKFKGRRKWRNIGESEKRNIRKYWKIIEKSQRQTGKRGDTKKKN